MFRLIALLLTAVAVVGITAPTVVAALRRRLYLRDLWQRATSIAPPRYLDVDRLLGFHRRTFANAEMVVTLAQAQQNAQTDLDVSVIDEFRTNQIMDLLQFDDAVNPAGGGATLTYGYRRLVALTDAAFRAINSEYTPSEVTTEQFTVDLKVLGGSFQIDRVLSRIGPRASGEVALQMGQKIKATQAKFGDSVINGDSDADPDGFDGLSKALRGSTTEDTDLHDWSDTMDEAQSFQVLEDLDEFLALLNGEPGAIIGNRRAIAKIRSAARRTSQYTRTPGPGATSLESYGNARLIDAGQKAGTNTDVITVGSVDLDNTSYTATVTGTPTGGTFSLLVTIDGDDQETGTIAYDASAATVKAALEALSNVPANSVTVTGSAGGPFTITFAGALSEVVVTLALSDNNLTGGTTPSVTVTEAATTTDTTGVTSLYAVRFALDGFHGVTTVGSPLIETWAPDFTKAGAVKTGEVEMGPVAVALKQTKSAAVMRNVKVA